MSGPDGESPGASREVAGGPAGREVRLRAMVERDLPAVMALERILFPEDAWSEALMRGEITRQPERRSYLVGVVGTQVVAYAGLAVAGGEGDVQTIAVAPEYQGRGVGTALLAALLEEAAARGCREVFLDVRADNDRARALYERFGFEAVGRRAGYYQPSGTDAVVMRLTDTRRREVTGCG